ncbi:MAG: hypothetical protein IH784_06970 [Bacteroidetes bacterium]|nr:hypothetical protein [Bacteroidota bacterium]
MFIAHFGVGFGAKKAIPKTSLGTLLLASQFIDLLWPFFVIFGIERVAIDPGNTAFTPLDFIYYPFSHSLLGVLIWALIFGAVYYFIKKDLKSSFILGILVLSHWILDFITHRPDLPIFLGSDSLHVGLGLWNSIIATVVIESIIFIVGVYLYFSVTKAKKKVGTYSLCSLLIFFVIIYLSNLFGPPPKSAEAVGYVSLAQWLIIAWAYWIDRNRSITGSG